MSTPTTASPRYHHATTSLSSRTPSTPSGRIPTSVAQAMPPLLSPQRAHSGARSPSPNYFGFHVSDSSYPMDTAQQHTRQNWSPPSSAVRSAAAFSPSIVPVDQNPDFAAFRRQSEGLGRTFSLSTLHNFSSSQFSIKDEQENTKATSGLQSPVKTTETSHSMLPPSKPGWGNLDPDSANLGRSPKRQLSSDSGILSAPPPRRNSPASYLTAEPASDRHETGSPERHSRTSLPPNKPVPSLVNPKYRSETLPASMSVDSTLITPQHVINLIESDSDSILILDLRVSTQYAKARISGALNLCIPTTLIKRPSFNVQKLAETFKEKDKRARFEKWMSCKYIIVYDASASQMKDAQICLNTIQKFESEGYKGTAYIVKGGFAEFSRTFPKYVDKGPMMSAGGGPPRLSLSGVGSGVDGLPPVIGGCPMPASKSAANPFFGNIRQNMDLIGGVGQMPIKRPESMTQDAVQDLPQWLRDASDVQDAGAKVSNKFLHIEKREQKRMQDALSGSVSYGDSSTQQNTAKSVQIAGIEKGSKNRYNNIWPFEHTRVKLQGVEEAGCDYVNANHIKSALSNKRYIATQGPIPTTFSDFWNVVWQQDVRVIVMLTAEKEGGQVKAHNYWDDKQYGPFALELLSERKASLDPVKIYRHRRRPSLGGRNASSNPEILAKLDTKDGDQPFVTVRKLTLSHGDYPFERMREITQLQYSSWPDFGAPAHPAHLLGLVEQCDAVVRSITGLKHTEPDPPESRPVLVHCSAGCGRTGTFCTVDSVLDMLKRQRINQDDKQGSPMDVDTAKVQDDSPFFGASTAGIDTTEDRIDGTWVTRQDQDLVEKTVEDFRHQRISMVQSLRQFVLCYEAIMEWLKEQDRPDKDDFA